MATINTVNKFFPKVKKVMDATKPLIIEVTKSDASSKGIKQHDACAMAVACKRKFHLDGVIISRSTAYMIKGKQARRFKLSASVAREVTSFDRGSGFSPGTYILSPVPPSAKSGQRRGSNKEHPRSPHKEPITKRFRHITSHIRTVLGGQEPEE